ncbi:hypothetical protein GCM10011351_09600 [Paraliobacillus quinghaiensis]|uniref:Putative amidase domain-containing protein n=1 Tax=Paraliobacillus quinghaiensis TaxID=470815 RepID=A0A917TKZ3_9BACI|nr:amidase domain-containing protein [Paraliobacillus quinghaiensis]GGM26047.1 hypothetical protein GCM10011351_09600 [Paraliobacillus quinghaiensis]
MELMKKLTDYWQDNLAIDRKEESENWIQAKKALHEQRGHKVPHISGQGKVIRDMVLERDEMKVNYLLGVTFLIKQGDHFYREEEQREHVASFYKGTLVEDQLKSDEPSSQEDTPNIEKDVLSRSQKEQRFSYDRHATVQYAERWWNDYNPAYKQFDVDCTNYVSQCLHAGGAPMRGYPDRSKGWWYQNEKWSYSWSVAHALRWYLSGSKQGLKGKAIEKPEQLIPGDVICYDFEGDGKWDHNTIVVSKDANGMPLVNAHTNNSRHRYWDYKDSYAWTSNCQYKFFRIGED